MVRTRPGKPEKSWNLKILNSRPGKSWKNTKKSVSPGISLEGVSEISLDQPFKFVLVKKTRRSKTRIKSFKWNKRPDGLYYSSAEILQKFANKII